MYRLFMVLLIAFASFFLSALVVLLLTEPLFGVSLNEITGNADYSNPSVLNALRLTQLLNAAALFLVPAFVYAFLMQKGFSKMYGFRVALNWKAVLVLFVLVLFALPLENFIGALNQKIHFPESLASLEQSLRSMEKTAEITTRAFLEMESFGIYLITMLIMAVLPAFGEELLFRGVIQKLFGEQFRNHHLAIWVTAVLFSAIHMQFFGFFPRLIMGAALGYLFYWSGSLWYPIIAHFLNNGIAVTMAYVIGMDKLPDDIENAGSEDPFLFLFSTSLCLLILYAIRPMLGVNKKPASD